MSSVHCQILTINNQFEPFLVFDKPSSALCNTYKMCNIRILFSLCSPLIRTHMTKAQGGPAAQDSHCLDLIELYRTDTFSAWCCLSVMLIFRTLRSNRSVRNYSLQNSWNATHVLFKHKEVSKNVYFIQEKYFEFSWNLANIFFIKVSLYQYPCA